MKLHNQHFAKKRVRHHTQRHRKYQAWNFTQFEFASFATNLCTLFKDTCQDNTLLTIGVAGFWEHDIIDATYFFETKFDNPKPTMSVAIYQIWVVLWHVNGQTSAISTTVVAHIRVYVRSKKKWMCCTPNSCVRVLGTSSPTAQSFSFAELRGFEHKACKATQPHKTSPWNCARVSTPWTHESQNWWMATSINFDCKILFRGNQSHRRDCARKGLPRQWARGDVDLFL